MSAIVFLAPVEAAPRPHLSPSWTGTPVEPLTMRQDGAVDTAVSVRPSRARRSGVDQVCAEAVDLARAAAIEEAGNPARVGDHLGMEAEGERMVVHRFA